MVWEDHIVQETTSLLLTMQLLRGLSLCIIFLSSRGQPVSTEPAHSPGGASLYITQIVIVPK